MKAKKDANAYAKVFGDLRFMNSIPETAEAQKSRANT